MPRLIVMYDKRELRECALGVGPVTIGRLPDNQIVIDNPAVSGRHARVYKDGEHFVLEDLKSTNGTFVNDKPIARHTLLEGDAVLVGKHVLFFTHHGEDDDQATAAIHPPVPDIGGTVQVDMSKHQALLSGFDRGGPSQLFDAVIPKTAIPTAQGRIGTLKVVRGNTGQPEYILTAVTTMIGKADTAQIRLRGWFKPKVAAAIARKGEGFTVTPMDGKVTINGARIDGRRDLASGDVIDVGGISLQFTLS